MASLATLATVLGGLAVFVILVEPPRRRPRFATAAASLGESEPEPAASDPVAVSMDHVLPDTPLEEATMPRWRRPSLRVARQSSTRGPEPARVAAVFRDPPAGGVVRGRIAYRLVRVSSIPDQLMGEHVATLDRDDEVELVRSSGRYWRVRTPGGAEGWIHRMTLSNDPWTEGPSDDTPLT